MKIIRPALPVCFICILFACSSPSNRRAVSTDELEKVQAADSAAQQQYAATRDALSATELIELADCADLSCVQLYMKDRDNDFVHARKGEFAALHRSIVTDTAGNEFVMPLSTLYADVNPQASWRLAHTLHRKQTGDRLLGEFQQLGFAFVDSGYFIGGGLKGRQARFSSPEYPGKNLYITATYHPWYMKGLYNNKVTWPCYVFEVYKD
ncbi:MAG: hypothetical protein J0H92_17010 [Sphingobacteriales bacterium]|nr:hypothetical protein [Sphingobacteriales bacterium]